MKILVACETSGTVRRAFRNKGHEAYSCDLLPSDDNSPFHWIGDALEAAYNWHWDMMICHPPCTHLAVSGAAWFYKKQKEQKEALEFVKNLLNAPIEKIALENPVSIISTHIRKPSQIIQPYMFGHLEQKKTCLWLKNLPLLIETNNVYKEMMMLPKRERERLHYLAPSKTRWKERSKTFEGIATAMAEQWGRGNTK